MTEYDTCIVGAGMTGLAAGFACDAPVFEASDRPGGICSSYYVRPHGVERLDREPDDGEAYHFEIGGGHWIFGGDPLVHHLLRRLVDLETYERSSGVYLPDRDLTIPYPLQNNLRYLDDDEAARAVSEMVEGARSNREVDTMDEWLEKSFGPTLCEIFFHPFHRLYTADLWREIAPQDKYKSPVDLDLAVRGAFDDTPEVGYNRSFVYPREGLDTLSRRLADAADVRYGKRVIDVVPDRKVLHFSDGTSCRYGNLISTVPLNRMIEISVGAVNWRPAPSPSVLVLNLGVVRGESCPDDHWLYVPESDADFHRVGFYSNVDDRFLPRSKRGRDGHAALYVEKSYPEDWDFEDVPVDRLKQKIVRELRDWGWIEDVEVADPTWIDVAYTWSWPDSEWRSTALDRLERHDVYQVGRYARWIFQGIAESIRDGLFAGASVRDETTD